MSGAKLTKGKARTTPDPSQLGLPLLKVYIIDLTVPWEVNVKEPYEWKSLKYTEEKPIRSWLQSLCGEKQLPGC